MKTLTNTFTSLFLSLAVISSICLTGCGGDDNPTGQTPTEEPTNGAAEVTSSK